MMVWFKEFRHEDKQVLVSKSETMSAYTVMTEFFTGDKFLTVTIDFDNPKERDDFFDATDEAYCKKIVEETEANFM